MVVAGNCKGTCMALATSALPLVYDNQTTTIRQQFSLCTTQVALNDSGQQPPSICCKNSVRSQPMSFSPSKLVTSIRDFKARSPIGLIPGNCQHFTFLCFCFITSTSKGIYLQLHEDVIVNTAHGYSNCDCCRYFN